MDLEAQYHESLAAARAQVAQVAAPDARAALTAALEAVSRLHLLVLAHEGETGRALFEVREQMHDLRMEA